LGPQSGQIKILQNFGLRTDNMILPGQRRETLTGLLGIVIAVTLLFALLAEEVFGARLAATLSFALLS
jgi:hypothetical protein